nr:cell division protein FtsI [uncultured Rhodoferax sp.]
MGLRRASLCVAVASTLLSGCGYYTVVPLWEVTKVAASGAITSLQSAPGQASNTIYHAHPTLSAVCIEYNPDAQTADVVPALQRALKVHAIESRVYEGQGAIGSCPVWLRYTTLMAWDKVPSGERYQSFVQEASLTLQSAQGEVLSSSQYEVGPGFGTSKWATVYDKLSPVVTALVTGVEPQRAGFFGTLKKKKDKDKDKDKVKEKS